jgi:mycothiol synthase
MRYRAPVPADAPAVLAVSDARDLADLGEAQHTLDELRDEWRSGDLDLARDARVVEDAGGRILAYAQVRRRGALVLVAPDHEGRGIGAQLLEWVEERERDRGHDVHRQWAASGNLTARALLTGAGYRQVRSYSTMVRRLERISAPSDPPAGFRLRPIDPARDATALHAVDADSFSPTPDYAPQSLAEFTDAELGSHDFDAAISRAAVKDDSIVGFLIAGRRPEEGVGWVHVLAVAPAHQNRGLGTAMLESSFAAFAEAGLSEVRLGVASYNPRALHVYQRMGMTERFRFDVYERRVAHDEPM